MRFFLTVFVSVAAFSAIAEAPANDDPENAYVARFNQLYPEVTPPAVLETYATQERFDALALGDVLDKRLRNVQNDKGGLAWGFSSVMVAFNDMYIATGDVKYLDANLRCIQATLDATDEKRGKQLWNGRVVPAWGSDKYAERGRAVFPVHTGVITAPIFQWLILAAGHAGYRDGLGPEFERIRDAARTALAVHDWQWVDGPGEGEGHFIGKDQEDVLENKPLPANRLSAMGWAMWLSHKLDGHEQHGQRARAIGLYMKQRMTRIPSSAYFWPYSLPLEPVANPAEFDLKKGEDSSHGSLTMAVVFALAADGEVFTAEDMKCFAQTLLQGFGRREDGILMPRISGTTDLDPGRYVAKPGKWLSLAKYVPEVEPRVMAFYLRRQADPDALDIALLLRWMKERPAVAR